MHGYYLETLLSRFQKRADRVRSSNWQQYHAALGRFWSFFDSNRLLVSIAEGLQARFPEGTNIANDIHAQVRRQEFPIVPVEGAWAAASQIILRQFAQNDVRTVRDFIPMQSSSAFDDYLSAFNGFYLDPFCDYVGEHLDDPLFVLAQLLRFKRLCEWFWRAELFDKWKTDSARGEKALGLTLYEYLFSEGIDFSIEPKSASGEADLISSQEGPERLLADVKVFNPDKSKGGSYVRQGFRQVHQYAADYNEPIAYLIIFNTSETQLRISTSGVGLVPSVQVNNKTVFFLIIDLYPHETTASKRPQPDVVEITEAQIKGTGEVSEGGWFPAVPS